ncbi:hypothetical protein GCM10009864_69870 [Streptomyces lunalinharesii]|uniref:Uncharacterized protein n=1 Tax=Streptomyces lunalinharesii TaxID=333384 RepID=A0ABP6FCA7_9ACTN
MEFREARRKGAVGKGNAVEFGPVRPFAYDFRAGALCPASQWGAPAVNFARRTAPVASERERQVSL